MLVALYLRSGNTNGVTRWLKPLARTTDPDVAFHIATLFSPWIRRTPSFL